MSRGEVGSCLEVGGAGCWLSLHYEAEREGEEPETEARSQINFGESWKLSILEKPTDISTISPSPPLLQYLHCSSYWDHHPSHCKTFRIILDNFISPPPYSIN
jgi:hypothetical protein